VIDVPAEELRRRLAAVVPVDRWVEEAAAGAPFDDVGALVAAVSRAIDGSPDTEIVDAARRAPAGAPVPPPGDDGLAPAEQGADAALARGDRVYEERFGSPFVLDASALAEDEVVDELQRRLTNSPDEEAAETRRQLKLVVERGIRDVFSEWTP
jgi:2-oxo-4-hydroxy-4-carboxy-5-ureidoimidazoline decarboxylase